MEYIIFIIGLIIIFILFAIADGLANANIENYDNYLFPIKGLGKECEADGLKPAYMPTVCAVDGKINSYANCKCVDKKTGACKVCYPDIKRDTKGRSVIYNAQDLNVDSENQ